MNVLSRLLQWTIGLILVGLFCVAANLFVLGPAQDWWHRADRQRLEALKDELDAERQVLDAEHAALEALADRIDRENAGLTSMQEEFRRIEVSNPRGIPPKAYRIYSRLVDDYNSRLRPYNEQVGDLRRRAAAYDEAVVRFNVRVEEANRLAKVVGTKWYLIPVPGRGRQSSAARSP